MKDNGQKKIVMQRTKSLKTLVESKPDVVRLEREVAILMLDVLAAIETRALSPEESSKIFVDLERRINLDIKQKVSEDFSALTAEGMLLNEIGRKYAPNLAELRELATRILSRDKKLVNYSVPSRTFA